MERADGWHRAVEFVAKSDMRGDIYEFGCFRGTSLTALYRASQEFEALTRGPFIDRFAGMPEGGDLDRLDGYNLALGSLRPGAYACSPEEFRAILRDNGVPLERVEIVEGFYEESLRNPATIAKTENSQCAVLHIDCDFEISARAALAFMTPKLQDRTVV